MALVFNDEFANDCLGAIVEKKDYHSDDYQYYAADNLLADTVVPSKFTASRSMNYDFNRVSYRELLVW